ncbi:MAG: hypothetical protein ACYCWW_16570 [Deltaproteobacteria bacterium]
MLAVALFTALALAQPACPPEGDGGDPLLNRAKNRQEAPEKPELLDVAALLSLPRNLEAPRYRDRWSARVRDEVRAEEQRGVALVGYLLAARQSGPESCNCHDPTRRDFHLWIGAAPAADYLDAKARRADAVIVEMTPSLRDRHPGWRLRTLERLAHDRAKVRVEGLLMYDPEHPGELGKTRGTLWEVHPITGFSVWSGGRWVAL